MGAKVTTYSVDVTDQHSTKESIDDFLSKINKIDLVIANAGLGELDALHKGNPTMMNEVINVNVIGVQNTIVPFLPTMLKQGRGHIALVGSVAIIRQRCGIANAIPDMLLWPGLIITILLSEIP